MIFDSKPQSWQELQSYVGQMFEECGFETEVSKIVSLVRGDKEIDVYAKDIHSEYTPVFLVECKFWTRPISQETIHSFRTVLSDFGANTGFIVSKNGFQSGSYKAAEKTNIRLVTLKDLEIEYYSKWNQGMINRYLPYSAKLFPYWDYPGKIPIDGGKIDFETQKLIHDAYRPLCNLDARDLLLKDFNRDFPIQLPTLDDNFKVVGEERIETDRQYFDFFERNKDRALEQFKKLYRE